MQKDKNLNVRKAMKKKKETEEDEGNRTEVGGA